MTHQDPELRQLLAAAARMERGPLQVATLEQAVILADGMQDRGRGFEARRELCEAATFAGHPEVAMVAFAWCLAEADRSGEEIEFAGRDLLWDYKWILAALPGFPQVSRVQIWAAVDDFCRRLEAAGENGRTPLFERWSTATRLYDDALAKELYPQWLSRERDELSDCLACETNARAQYFLDMNEDKQALEIAAPVLKGYLRCYHSHLSLLSAVLCVLVRTGQQEAAARYHDQAYRQIAQNSKFLSSMARHIEYLRLIGNIDRAVGLLERHFPWVLGTHCYDDAFNFYNAGRQVLLTLNTPSRPIALPQELSQVELAGRTDARHLQDWLERKCSALAEKFDRRNGNDAFRKELDRPLEAPMHFGPRPAPAAKPGGGVAPGAQPSLGARTQPEVKEPNAKAQRARKLKGKRIYVVDDDSCINDFLKLTLERAGCQVAAFQNRIRALATLRRERSTPDLLITDWDGFPISATVFMGESRKAHPTLKILLATGYPEGIEAYVASNRPDAVLHKPFSSEALLDVVESLCVETVRTPEPLNAK